MEKNAGRGCTCRKRLLTLCMVSFFYMAGAGGILYAEQTGGIALAIDRETLTVGDVLAVTVTVDAASLYARRGPPSLSFKAVPAIVFVEGGETSPYEGGFRLKYRLKMTQTGTVRLFTMLHSGKKTVPLQPFEAVIRHPPLSAKTVFSWAITDAVSGKTYTAGDAGGAVPVLQQGNTYLLYLTALYYDPQQPEPAAGIVSALPEPLHRIECPAPENAVLTAIPAGSRLPFIPDLETGRQTVAAFEWIPLYTGTQALPEAELIFSDGTKTRSQAALCKALPQQAPSAHSSEPPLPHEAFTAPADSEGSSSGTGGKDCERDSNEQTCEQTGIARMIAENRYKELHTAGFLQAYKTRRQLEQQLHIEKPLPVYPHVWWISMSIVSTAVCIAGFWFFGLKQRYNTHKTAAVCVTVCWLLLSSGTGMLYRRSMQVQGVCVADGAASSVRRIPDAMGKPVFRLITGESVLILEHAAGWYYITTAENLAGWIPQEAVTVYSTR